MDNEAGVSTPYFDWGGMTWSSKATSTSSTPAADAPWSGAASAVDVRALSRTLDDTPSPTGALARP
jgi:hypothetical protein